VKLIISTAILICTAAIVWAASTSFTGTLIVDAAWRQSKVVGVSTVSESFSELLRQTHTDGTNANQMSAVVAIDGSLADSASVTYNLAGGVTNSFGDAVTFADVRFFAVYSDSSANSNIAVGGADSTAFDSWLGVTNSTVLVAPGGLFMFTSPNDGFCSTNGNIKVSNTGTNTVTYQVYIGGIE
jgi:hypothetical protein